MVIESKSEKNQITAPAHPLVTGIGHVSSLVAFRLALSCFLSLSPSFDVCLIHSCLAITLDHTLRLLFFCSRPCSPSFYALALAISLLSISISLLSLLLSLLVQLLLQPLLLLLLYSYSRFSLSKAQHHSSSNIIAFRCISLLIAKLNKSRIT